MANNALLDRVMRHIEHNEHLWNQNAWSRLVVNGFSGEELRQMLLEDPTDPVCGTTRCFAGHVVAFEGWKPIFEVYEDGSYYETYTSMCANKAGEQAAIPAKATELLQVDEETADKLFEGGNTLEDLQSMVAYIKDNGDLTNYGRTVHECDCDYCNVEFDD